MTTLHVATAAEGAYVPHSGAMLRSLVDNAGVDVRVHYLHGPGLREVHALRSLVARLELHEVGPEELTGVPTRGFTRTATWYRVFLPELLPHVDRVLYLDADVLVLDSLAELATLDLGDRHVAAVTNVFQPDHRFWPGRLGLDERDYFNAGVLLLDLERMRRDRSTDALLAYAREHAGELRLRDQDAANAVLRRLPLHPRFNAMHGLRFPHARELLGDEAVAEALARPAIRHFEGPSINKPWHYLAPRRERELYARHRAATPWPRVELEGRTPANVARRLLRRSPRARFDADR